VNIGIAVLNYDASEGTGGYTVQLVSRVAQAHQVTLYAAAVRAPVPAGVTVVRVPALRGRAYAEILSFPLAFAAVRRRHDVLHAQGWVTGAADVVTAHIVMRGWREAATAAGIWPGWGERIFGPVAQWQEGKLFQRTRAVIAPSAKVQAELARWYGRSAGVTVVHHGFPAPGPRGDRAAARRKFGCPADAFLALYVGDGRKGLGAALDALAATPDTHLLVVGHASYASFQARAATLGLAGRVHWAGSQPSLAEAYAAADVLLQPTIYDSFGMVVAEAMAAGLAVIVSRNAGVTELIADRRSGWLLGSDPAAEGAAALRALRDDAPLRHAIAAAARAVANSRSWDAVVRDTIAVYQQAAAR
jgi:UDP-glucose:(heptosyl)LPS alpha-1,3-glucosyltransferase